MPRTPVATKLQRLIHRHPAKRKKRIDTTCRQVIMLTEYLFECQIGLPTKIFLHSSHVITLYKDMIFCHNSKMFCPIFLTGRAKKPCIRFVLSSNNANFAQTKPIDTMTHNTRYAIYGMMRHARACIASAAGTAMLLAACCAAVSCDNDNDDFPIYPLNRPNAIVTVKPTADGAAFYMQLDDSTRINATNIHAAPYGNREVRALVNYRLLAQPAGKRQYDVYINWIDSVLTKPMASYAALPSSTASGPQQDPVEIMRDWTVSEDGYLTIHFRTQWAANGTPHIVNLAAADDAHPYELTFFHDAQGVKGGYWGDGLVAFRLDRLPDTGGKTADMTLHWMSFSGEKSVKFKYSTRRGTYRIDGLSSAQSGQMEKAIR